MPQLFYTWSYFNKYSYIYLINYNCYVNISLHIENIFFCEMKVYHHKYSYSQDSWSNIFLLTRVHASCYLSSGA